MTCRIFKTRHFERWMQKTELSDLALCAAVSEMRQGLIDADLGGGVLKKRVAFGGRGKSAGVRTLVATNKNDRWFYVFGFSKNVRANITDEELRALRSIGADLLLLTRSQLNAAIADRSLQELHYEQ